MATFEMILAKNSTPQTSFGKKGNMPPPKEVIKKWYDKMLQMLKFREKVELEFTKRQKGLDNQLTQSQYEKIHAEYQQILKEEKLLHRSIFEKYDYNLTWIIQEEPKRKRKAQR